MIQIIGLLLCVYLFVKGIEVLQIALCSPRTDKGGAMAVGVLTLVGCTLIGGLAALLLVVQGASIPTPS